MNSSSYPSFFNRIYSVWYRHLLVYTRHLFSNGFPPFMEPLIFLAGIGLGLGQYIGSMEGIPYVQYLIPGLIVVPAMFTASFECTFGTFLRLEFENVYDGMLGSPLTVNNLMIGELVWAGTKGMFFSFAVLVVVVAFGFISWSTYYLAPFIGFLTGMMFGGIALFFTSFITTINHINFFITGVLSPMFFFSGVVFPISSLPATLQPIAELLPLTHTVRMLRYLGAHQFEQILLWDLLYCVLITIITGYIATRRLKARMIE